MKGEMSFITIVNVWLKAGSNNGECDWKQGWKMKIYSTVFSGKGNIFYGAHQDTEQSVEGNVEVVHRSTYLSHLHTFTFNVSSATRTRYQMYPNIYNSYPQLCSSLPCCCSTELCPAVLVWVSPVRTGAVAARAGARQMGWAVATGGPSLTIAIFILCLPLFLLDPFIMLHPS